MDWQDVSKYKHEPEACERNKKKQLITGKKCHIWCCDGSCSSTHCFTASMEQTSWSDSFISSFPLKGQTNCRPDAGLWSITSGCLSSLQTLGLLNINAANVAGTHHRGNSCENMGVLMEISFRLRCRTKTLTNSPPFLLILR